MNNGEDKTVTDYIKEFFEQHPNEEIEHGRVGDYVFEHIPKARDPWRAIRKLYQEGWLIKVRKGVYKKIPQYKGGTNTIENGQTLCSEHNLMKKRYGTVDFLGQYCKKMIALAKEHNDIKIET